MGSAVGGPGFPIAPARMASSTYWAPDASGICTGTTAPLRFQEWVCAGEFLELWGVGLEGYDELKGVDRSWVSMDGAMTKAPLGGGKNRPQSH